jgi:hypothetical protein
MLRFDYVITPDIAVFFEDSNVTGCDLVENLSSIEYYSVEQTKGM